jgi:ribosome-binding protein aMBF1 (putative translation factor)
MTTVARVAINEHGRRIGETHHNARIPDSIIDRIRERREDDGITYRALAQELNLSINTIGKILTYQRRAQTPVAWKRLET